MVVETADFLHRHSQHLGIGAGFIGHHQHAKRSATHDYARQQWYRGQHQHIDRITVFRQRMRNIAVVGRILHGRTHEPIDENSAAILIDLVFDRVALHRDFDDDVEIIRQGLAGRHLFE